jgi:uncharacterized phage protein gp47/JayE
MEIKTYEEIRDAIINYMIAHQDRLTDFNEGSVIGSQTEAIARELAAVYIRCRVGFSTYLRGLPYSVFGFKQKDGLKASARLVFARARPYTNATAIPVGTVVAAGGLRFVTTQAGEVAAGASESGEIAASAAAVGAQYNIGAGLIKTVVSALPADIVGVNNPAPATGGNDSEDWGAYVSRFSDYILGLSRTNGSGFRSALMAIEWVRSVSIVEHFPPLDGIWNMTVYVEDGSGGMTAEGISAVKQIVDGDWTAAGDGGYRAPGIAIRYLTPEIIPVSARVTVTVALSVVAEIDNAAIVAEVTEAAQKHINGLTIGDEFWTSDMIVALRRIDYLLDADIDEPGDIEIAANQIARFQSCAVTVVVR